MRGSSSNETNETAAGAAGQPVDAREVLSEEFRRVWEVAKRPVVVGDTLAFRERLREVAFERPLVREQLFSKRIFSKRRILGRQTLLEKGVFVACAMVLFAFIVWRHVWMLQSARNAHQGVVARYTTRAGQFAELDLDRGIHVHLGPMTTLTRIAAHVKNDQQVTVIGQALFTVIPRHAIPFSVRTGNVLTRVLGTTFSVRKYPTDHTVQVVVADGRVVVQRSSGTAASNRDALVVMNARTVANIPDSGRVSVVPNIAVDDYTTWTTRQLVFHDTPVPAILTEVSRVYDAQIRLSDSSLAENLLTVTIPVAAHSLDDVLHVLMLTLDAHYSRVGRAVIIYPGRAQTRRPASPLTQTSERSYGR